MAATLTQARRDFLALKDALDEGLDVRVRGTEELRALRAEMEKTAGAMAHANVTAPSAGGRAPGGGPVAPKTPAAAVRSAQKAASGGKDDEGPGGIGRSAEKGVKYLAKQLGIGRAAMAAFAVAGALELTKLAMGFRGMTTLSALGMRASYSFRRLFSGIDPSPVLRAASRLFSLVDGSTQTGKALQRMFTDAFGSAFRGVEGVEPMVRAFLKGMLIGAQEVEIAWLRLRIAAKPFTDAISDMIGPMDGIKAAGTAGSAAVGLLALKAAVAAGPFLAFAAAIAAVTAALAQFQKLQQEIKGAGGLGQAFNDMKRELRRSTMSKEDREKEALAQGRRAFDEAEERRRAPPGEMKAPPGEVKAAGAATGKAYADGIVQGVQSGLPAVGSAGEAVAQALDAGTRKKGEVHSPSKLAERTGEEFPAGTAQGIRNGKSDVDAAAADVMVPRVGAGKAGASAGVSGASISVSIGQINVNGEPASPNIAEALRALVRAIFQEELRAALLQIGGVPA